LLHGRVKVTVIPRVDLDVPHRIAHLENGWIVLLERGCNFKIYGSDIEVDMTVDKGVV